MLSGNRTDINSVRLQNVAYPDKYLTIKPQYCVEYVSNNSNDKLYTIPFLTSGTMCAVCVCVFDQLFFYFSQYDTKMMTVFNTLYIGSG